jgi:hypothetical protein
MASFRKPEHFMMMAFTMQKALMPHTIFVQGISASITAVG